MDDEAREEIARLRKELRDALNCVVAYQHTITGRMLANSAALDALLCGIRMQHPDLRAVMSEAFVYAVEGLVDSTADLDPRIAQARDERVAALQCWLEPVLPAREARRAA